MHEIAISETICQTIEREAKKHNIAAVKIAKLRIGKMAAFDRSNLDLCLKEFAKKPVFAEAAFEIEEVPVELECADCHHHFVDARFDDFDFAHTVAHAPALYQPPACPKCQSTALSIQTGQEMELVSIE